MTFSAQAQAAPLYFYLSEMCFAGRGGGWGGGWGGGHDDRVPTGDGSDGKMMAPTGFALSKSLGWEMFIS